MKVIPYAGNSVLSLDLSNRQLILQDPFTLVINNDVIQKVVRNYKNTKEIGGIMIGHDRKDGTILIDDVIILPNKVGIGLERTYNPTKQRIREVIEQYNNDDSFIPFLFHTHVLGKYSLISPDPVNIIIDKLMASLYMEPSFEDVSENNMIPYRVRNQDFVLPELVLSFSQNMEAHLLITFYIQTSFPDFYQMVM